MLARPITRLLLCFSGVILFRTLAPATLGAQGLESLLRLRDGRGMAASSTHKLADGRPDPDSNSDNFRVAPGKTHVLADLKGPGVIQHIWLTFLGPEPQDWAPKGAANHQEMLLRMYWDGRERPDVEAPVGDFFASGFGRRMNVNSIPVVVENGASYNCFWPMPFAKSARIEILNQGTKPVALLYYQVDWVTKDKLEEATPYFCARYQQSYPAQKGHDYMILDIEGRGHYVGTVLSERSRSPEWFGEGDVKMEIDDDQGPSIWGTGSEDYFLSAWGLRTTSAPYAGVPFTDGFGVHGGRTCAYRWHIADAIPFQRRIRVSIEHYGWLPVDENPNHKRDSWNEREDDFASVAFWYQVGPSCPPQQPSTTAEQRRLPEIDKVVRGADLADSGKHGAGEITAQNGDLWTSGSQLLYRPPSEENAWLEIPFDVDQKKPMRLVLALTVSYDFGMYQPILDGVKIGKPLNLYARKTDLREFPLLDFWPDAGPHTLRLECAGKDRDSSGCWLGLDALRLRRRRKLVEELGLDKDKDWKREQQLY